jgi:hypothetical protein
MDDQRWPDPVVADKGKAKRVTLETGPTIPLLLTGAPVLRRR